MRVGIGAGVDVEWTVERCRQLGVDRVFVTVAALAGVEETGIPELEALKCYKGRLEEQGIAVPVACQWLCKWPFRPWRQGSTNPDVLLSGDRRTIEAGLRTIEVLAAADIHTMLHYVDFGRPERDEDLAACWDGLIALYREMIPVAESCGMRVANHPLHRLLYDGVRERAVAAGARLADYDRFQIDGWGGPFLVGTWRELRRLLAAAPSPSNGVTLCTGMDIVGGDMPALTREFAGRIYFCQLRDHTDDWPSGREVPMGEGRVDLGTIVRTLREVGYDGFVNLEHLGKPRDGQDLEAMAFQQFKMLMDD